MATLTRELYQKLLTAKFAFGATTGRCPTRALLSIDDAYVARKHGLAHVERTDKFLGHVAGMDVYAGTHGGEPILSAEER